MGVCRNKSEVKNIRLEIFTLHILQQMLKVILFALHFLFFEGKKKFDIGLLQFLEMHHYLTSFPSEEGKK